MPSSDADPLRQRVEKVFRQHFASAPAVVTRAPGRVNLLGAHVDYSEGWVLPAAIDRSVVVAAGPADDGVLDFVSLDCDDRLRVGLDALPPPVPERQGGGAGWSDLPVGLAWCLARAGHRPAGLRAVFASDVPIGAGVSSSAAVEMAFLLVFEILARAGGGGGLGLDGPGRARLGQVVENEYLGVGSGVMDQYASLHGRAGHALFLDCRILEHRLVPLPAQSVFLVADSGVRRRLSASGFNDRRAQCEEAVARLRPLLEPGQGPIRTLRDISAETFEGVAHHLPIELRRRAQHAIEECTRGRSGAAALEVGNLGAFAALVRRSHASSRDLYEVSIPEIDTLAAAAWAVPGCWGARLSGGGFGGCVTALVGAESVAAVSRAMADVFEATYHRRPEIFACRPSDGATIPWVDPATLPIPPSLG